MSFPNRTDYLDPTGRRTTSTPAVSVASAPPPTRAYAAVGPQTYAPIALPHRRRRRKLSPMWTAFVALVVGLGLAVPVVLLAADHNDVYVLPHTPSAAEAKAACKSAIEAEAQGRLENAERDAGDSIVPSLAGVDIDEPVRTASGYTVNGTLRFSAMSFLGSLPATMFVTCTATIKGSALETDVQNR